MLAWLPYEDREEAEHRLGGLPEGVEMAPFTDPRALPDSVGDVEFLVTPYMTGATALDRVGEMTALRHVQTLTAGFDDVLDRIPDSVALHNAAGVHDTATAELAIGLMLAQSRNLDDNARSLAAGRWEPSYGESIADKHVLIVGHGRIGKAIEARLAGFEVGSITRVARTAREGVHAFTELDDLLPAADVVVLICPLTPQTEGLMDGRRLALMADNALLVNVARGRVVVTDALVAELRAGRLRAAVDVVDPEPLPEGHPLWSCPNFLLSPHTGGWASSFWPRADRLIASQLRRWAAGEALANRVN